MNFMCRGTLFILFLLLSVYISSGCAPKYVSSITSPKWEEAGVTKVAVVPFVFAPAGELKDLRSARVDMEGRVCYEVAATVPELRSARVVPEGVAIITSLFVRGVERLGYSVIPYDDGTKEKLSPQGTLPFDIVRSIGEATGAEVVLTGVVTRYEEREGGPIGVRKPASIGFEANLIRTIDGTLLWSGRYAETQKSLVEDLGLIYTFFKRRGKWLTAEELARYGVDEVLKTIPVSPLIHPTPVH